MNNGKFKNVRLEILMANGSGSNACAQSLVYINSHSSSNTPSKLILESLIKKPISKSSLKMFQNRT